MTSHCLPLILIVIVLAACGGGPAGSTPDPADPGLPGPRGTGGINAVEKQALPHIVLVSIDGFRWDYPDQYVTPAIDRLIANGVRAQSLRPQFPTVTFPNHYSIATGLTPSNHGIVANAFPSRDRQRWYSLNDPSAVGDGSWYGGVPVWVAAEASGLVAAAYFFVGTEAEIGGIRPTYWQPFDASVPGSARIDQALQWLDMPDETRPHLITLYFGTVDKIGHQFGPDAVQTGVAVASVDQLIGQLLDGVDQSPVSQEIYLILVSDHGMSTHIQGSSDLVLTDIVDLTEVAVVGGGSYAFLFFDQDDPNRAVQIRDTINAGWPDGQAWLRDGAPVEWNVTPDSRFPDVIVQADDRYRVANDPARLAQLPVGLHGWAPGFAAMDGIFIASGPRLPRGVSVDTVSVLDIYPLILEILEIPLTGPIDGDTDALAGLLEDQASITTTPYPVRSANIRRADIPRN